MFEERIERIRNAFRDLQAADSGFDVFGAEKHRYQLVPVVTEEFIAGWERNAHVQLPLDYREFLLLFSSGGAGPHYGLSLFPSASQRAGLPFPCHQAWNEKSPVPFDSPDYKCWEDAYFSEDRANGTVKLCDEGCGHITILVVTGPERGNVWGDSRVSDGGLYPLSVYEGHGSTDSMSFVPLYDSHHDRRISFLDWYEAWVTASLARFRQRSGERVNLFWA